MRGLRIWKKEKTLLERAVKSLGGSRFQLTQEGEGSIQQTGNGYRGFC